MWPIHPKLLPDELLSSWLIRMSKAYLSGLHTFTDAIWPRRQIWNRDIDRLGPNWMVDHLALRTGVSRQRVQDAVLATFEGIVFEDFRLGGIVPWLLPLGVWHRKRLRAGLQFCPDCLGEGTPYYRRQWRLAFRIGCTRHGMMYQERCPQCGKVAAPHRVTAERANIGDCWQCNTPLRTADRILLSSEERRFQRKLNDAVKSGVTTLAPYQPIYSNLYFAGLRVIARFLWSKRGRPLMRDILGRQGSEMPPFARHSGIEREPVEIRRALMLASARMLEAWPQRFLGLCKFHAVRGSDFRGGLPRGGLPFWMETVVGEEIDAPRHSPSIEEMVQASCYLLRQGIYPHKSRVAACVGMHHNSLGVQSYRSIMQLVEIRLGGRLPFLEPLPSNLQAGD